MPIIESKIKPDSIVYTANWTTYNKLDIAGFKHFRINHSVEFANKRNHINSIENFWNQAKREQRKYNGVPRENFHLFLKECEFRFNFGSPKQQLKTLKKWCTIGSLFLVSFSDYLDQPLKKSPLIIPIKIVSHAVISGFIFFAIAHSQFYQRNKCPVFEKIWFCNACIAYILLQNTDMLFYKKTFSLKKYLEMSIKTITPLTHNFLSLFLT